MGWPLRHRARHDPAILMSDDGGDTWRLALTEDFTADLMKDENGFN